MQKRNVMSAAKGAVQAVHDDDLETLLGSLDLLVKVRAGRIACVFCKEPVTEKSLHALLELILTFRWLPGGLAGEAGWELGRRLGEGMATVDDVAAYILKRQGLTTTMKLQKLVYYSQAWSLVWDDKPLFRDRIEAWANGPVCPALYRKHRKEFAVRRWLDGDPTNLTDTQRETIDVVLGFYGDKSSQWLSDLTHAEAPWKNARQGMHPGQPSNAIITHAAMAEYYGSLTSPSA